MEGGGGVRTATQIRTTRGHSQTGLVSAKYHIMAFNFTTFLLFSSQHGLSLSSPGRTNRSLSRIIHVKIRLISRGRGTTNTQVTLGTTTNQPRQTHSEQHTTPPFPVARVTPRTTHKNTTRLSSGRTPQKYARTGTQQLLPAPIHTIFPT